MSNVEKFARHLLEAAGWDLRDDAPVHIEESVRGEGCCDWCYHESPVVEISAPTHGHMCFLDWEYGDLVDFEDVAREWAEANE